MVETHETAATNRATKVRLAAVAVLAALLLFAVGFVFGASYAVQKHEDMYCPQPSGPGVAKDWPTGCRDGEGLFN